MGDVIKLRTKVRPLEAEHDGHLQTSAGDDGVSISLSNGRVTLIITLSPEQVDELVVDLGSRAIEVRNGGRMGA